MKLLCRGNHWTVINGQLVLAKPKKKDRDLENAMLSVIVQRVLRTAVDDILAIDFTKDREAIVRYGIDKVPAYVQNLCVEALKNSGQLRYAKATQPPKRWYSRKSTKAE